MFRAPSKYLSKVTRGFVQVFLIQFDKSEPEGRFGREPERECWIAEIRCAHRVYAQERQESSADRSPRASLISSLLSPCTMRERPACTCGSIGCAEAEAGGWALPGVVKDWPSVSASALSTYKDVGFKELFEEAARGDSVALAIRDVASISGQPMPSGWFMRMTQRLSSSAEE